MTKIEKIFSAGILNAITVLVAYSSFRAAKFIFDRNKMGKDGFSKLKSIKDAGIKDVELVDLDNMNAQRKKDLKKQIMASTSFSMHNLTSKKVALFFEKFLSPSSEFTWSRAVLNFKLLPGYNYLKKKKIKILSIGCRDEIELVAIRNRFPKAEVKAVDLFASKNSEIIKGDMHDLPFSNDYFDVIISSHSLEHANDYKKAASEFVRVSKNKSFIIIEVPSFNPEGTLPSDLHKYEGRPESSPDNWDYHNPECLNSIFDGFTNLIISDTDDKDHIKSCLQVIKN